MPSPTNVRAGKVAALLAGFQSAKGTPVSDFAAAGVWQAWTADAGVPYSPVKSDPQGWMTGDRLMAVGRHSIPAAKQGALRVKGTPTALEQVLRSCWGTYAANGAFSLVSQISTWLTLGWIEEGSQASSQYLVRLWDAWVHSIGLGFDDQGALSLDAAFVAERDDDPVALDDLGGISIPALPLEVADQAVFPRRLVQLIRDPAGEAVELSPHALDVDIDQGAVIEWDDMAGRETVYQGGFPGPRVSIDFTAHVSDETWAVINAARAGTRERWRLLARTERSPQRTLQMDFYEVDFEFDDLGHVGPRYRAFRGSGQAHADASGNFVSIALT